MMVSVNPANEKIISEYKQLDNKSIERHIDSAAKAYKFWSTTSFSVRSEVIKKVSNVLLTNIDRFAKLITDEMGKPISQSIAEVEKCAWVCDYYADHAENLLKGEEISTEASVSHVVYEPLGVVLGIMPWNFPFWQVFRFSVPTLMAGNVVLIKHASNVTGCAIAMEDVFKQTDLTNDIFQTIVVDSQQVSNIISHPLVVGVSLTGSEKAGASVASIAGSNIKKVVLELGGSDPFIVLKDADIQNAAKQAAIARTINSGQSCIAAKRFIVEKDIYQKFSDEFVSQMSQLRVGNPLDTNTQIGPLARKDLMDILQQQVERTVRSGAKLRLGGSPLQQVGYFYPPTVLEEVFPGMATFDEETFGPVATLTPANDHLDAIQLANVTSFGLGSSIWTSNTKLALQMARQLLSGNVFVNAIVKSDPRLPFGGIKRSGYGRELAAHGIREFTNIKTIYVL